MEKYRIRERVGIQEYTIQKKIITKKYVENPNFIQKIIFFL